MRLYSNFPKSQEIQNEVTAADILYQARYKKFTFSAAFGLASRSLVAELVERFGLPIV
jgi:hypothetical protein